MARALGGRVGPSRAPEIGWHAIQRTAKAAADEWFGTQPVPRVFQWHYEAFTLPPGAQALATSPACDVQAFALGPHLAMQFHVEQNAPKLLRWTQAHEDQYPTAQQQHPDTVQSPASMLAEAPACLPAQQALAARLYRRWLQAAPP
jgi:GMP synthase-like glutamine amidotransferase